MTDHRAAILGRISQALGHEAACDSPAVMQRVNDPARGPQPQWPEAPRKRFLAKLARVAGFAVSKPAEIEKIDIPNGTATGMAVIHIAGPSQVATSTVNFMLSPELLFSGVLPPLDFELGGVRLQAPGGAALANGMISIPQVSVTFPPEYGGGTATINDFRVAADGVSVAGADGTLFVADQVRSRVLSWSPAGEPLGEWPAGLLSGPRRLALGLFGTEPVVAAIMADGTVEVHLAGDGNLLSSFRPLAGDGGQIDAADLAVGANGRLYLADARRRAVFVFAPAPDDTLTPTATGIAPLPSATPGSLSCVVRGDKQAGPSTVVLGSAASVTLTLSADCPQSARLVGADIVLVIDRSGSMQGAKLASAREAARSFAELLDVRHHRLGLASFSDQASIDVPLTDSVPAVIDGLYALRAEGGTDLTAALEREGVIRGWRDEMVSVTNHYAAPELLRIERAATRHFGMMAYGAHLNGFTRRHGEPYLWIARRAASKSVDPDRLDNLVGGRIACGYTVDETIRKEAWEEAGIPEPLTRGMACASVVRVEYSVPEGLHREVIFTHDLWLPEDFRPQNQDGEVARLYCLSIPETIEAILAGEFTLDAGAVTVDALLRNAVLAPEDPQYLDLVRLLRP